MTTDQIILFSCIAGLIVVLLSERVRPSMAFFGAIIALVATDILEPEEAIQGFANEQLFVIVLLLTVSQVLSKTRILDQVLMSITKTGSSVGQFLLRITGFVGLSSAFLNNTPLVAILLPSVNRWGLKSKVNPSRLLIPLSYASILGGCLTLVGNSTHLVVNGLAIDSGISSLGMFDFLPVGGTMLVLGGLYIILFNRTLLPDRQSPMQQVIGGKREYFLEAHIRRSSPLVGKTVETGGLRNLDDLFLAEIEREGRLISPVRPTEELRDKDKLFFVGKTEAIADISRPDLGLNWPENAMENFKHKGDVAELVVGYNAEIIGKTVKDCGFRGNYDAVILAVHRNGTRLSGKIGDQVVHAGDVLLVLTGDDFNKRVSGKKDLYLLSTSEDFKPAPPAASYLVLFGLLGCLGLSMVGVPLILSLSVLLLSTLILGLVSTTDLRRSLDFELIVVIALGLALGKAMIGSGAAGLLAESMSGLSNWGSWAVLGTLFLVTNGLASLITSKAAVAVTLPVALAMAASMGHPAQPYVLTIAFAGATSFITPIGYQTNLMVYGPGNYRFLDFMRFGLPLTILYLIVTVIILSQTYNL